MADLKALVAPDWADALEPVHDSITAAGEFLRTEIAAGHAYLPAGPPGSLGWTTSKSTRTSRPAGTSTVRTISMGGPRT